ncbi:hypothetical protein, partial [Aestuariivirga sp.]|uniref:hypothetical protein n=1 Tax=Aestuariivirga sp. TaxID=2650926 RepID=UPI0035B15557
YGRTQPIHDRGGKSATTHHRKGRLTMTQGHRRNYTTLTDVTKSIDLRYHRIGQVSSCRGIFNIDDDIMGFMAFFIIDRAYSL